MASGLPHAFKPKTVELLGVDLVPLNYSKDTIQKKLAVLLVFIILGAALILCLLLFSS